MSFARTSFYDAPFPSDDLRTPAGTIDISGFPDPGQVTLMEQARGLLAGVDGFALAGAIYFQASAALDATTLPDAMASLGSDASVAVVGIDPTAADFLVPHPLDVAFLADGGRFGAPDLLAALPIQGAPLAAGETYAAYVTTAVHDADGHPLAASPVIAELARNGTPAGLTGTTLASYRQAVATLATANIAADTLAGLAVFTTEHATATLDIVRADILSRPPPTMAAPPTMSAMFDDYCTFSTTIDMPDYQTGTPPYTTTGGAWGFDGSGHPIVDHSETARVTFTIPRQPTPANGWPLVIFVRTGGGGDEPLVERGVCSTPEFTTPIVPGSGPAQDFAQIGFAGVEVDGPLGGIRNPTGQDEEFLIFNITNAAALRDNIRESAVELDLFAHVAPAATFDGSACPGATAVTFDSQHVALMGHSMGAWIAPLVLASEPTFGAAILSGAGGSYIANIVDKQKPIAPAPVIGALLDDQIDRHSPALTLIQWAAEPSDPQVYAPAIVRGATQPRSVLMLQGIVDHYIMPSIADATSLALGLDEAGPEYDSTSAELAADGQPELATQLPLVGRSMLALPASANVDAATTAVVVQHPGDAIEDGHEVVFQTEPPKHQYRCFLTSWLVGAPVVVPDGGETDPCP